MEEGLERARKGGERGKFIPTRKSWIRHWLYVIANLSKA